jgi:drug/metabolite transporter (DMT)-like permease
MRLVALTALVMVAFAANSVLNRAAVGAGEIGPLTFAAVRLVTGAAALWAFVAIRKRAALPGVRDALVGSASLLAYMLGFSLAYLRLDAGLGALILFGGVQVTMFAGAVALGERPPALRWAGSVIALLGLAWLFWPTVPEPVDPLFAGSMAVAAIGWGIYSLNGRRVRDALTSTAANFALASPVALGLALLAGAGEPATTTGLMLAAVSGIVTSGMGYALWYGVLPRLETGAAALSQLTVPLIAMAGGLLLLGEPITLTAAIGAALVIGGVAFGLIAPARRHHTSGSSGS